MPFISTKIKIQGTKFDRRVKLNDDDKEFIRFLHEEEQVSQRKLAFRFGVSPRLIGFVLKPEMLAKNIALRLERGGSMQYYNKDKQREYVREHRQYKQELKVNGLIHIN